jgi:hypothetical protein
MKKGDNAWKMRIRERRKRVKSNVSKSRLKLRK